MAMRKLMMLPMVAVVLGGMLPPMAPAFAQRGRVSVPDDDYWVNGKVDAARLCARYTSNEYQNDYSGMVTRTRTGRGGQNSVGMAPPAPPPPPPPAASPPPVLAAPAQEVVVTGSRVAPGYIPRPPMPVRPPADRDRYTGEAVSGVFSVAETPVSTFSVDVDTGSYSNARRMLTQDNRLPPSAAVRTEEMLNYFRYDYPAPQSRTTPFSVTSDISVTPWNAQTRLMRVGLRGYDVTSRQRPAANLVFLVDVSGSMHGPDRLGLVQCSLALMAEQLTSRDRVSIITYASGVGTRLEPTNDPRRIISALAGLRSGGGTAGGAGLELAYETARRSFQDGAINRIILATDGDFNLGVSNNDALLDMIARQRESGIQLTTLGFGRGNFNEALMEQAADKGNGNYAYIDSVEEARRVLQQQLSSTLFTIAHDVKIQVEFNPARVSEYRLIGYENRALNEEDFSNDAVDAGEIGAGHQVTAIYEIVPVGQTGWMPDRHFAANRRPSGGGDSSGDVAQIRLRYKLPGQQESRLISSPVTWQSLQSARAPTGDAAFAIAVAGFGQKLRGDTRLGRWSYTDIARLARPVTARDPMREQFLTLVDRAAQLQSGGREQE